jgi:hypothetical protein
MATRVSNSRRFAVVMTYGATMGVYFLWKRTEVETGTSSLENEAYQFPKEWGPEKDSIIELLKKAGLTVRYFDREEKQWMDQSSQYGLTPAPGRRDGGWDFPNLETFERDYLNAV